MAVHAVIARIELTICEPLSKGRVPFEHLGRLFEPGYPPRLFAPEALRVLLGLRVCFGVGDVSLGDEFRRWRVYALLLEQGLNRAFAFLCWQHVHMPPFGSFEL